MSEQKHTPEPWSIGRYDEISASTSDNFGGRINLVGVSTPITAGPDMDEAKANARRIVACVNACAGINTENLEQNKPLLSGLRSLNDRIRNAERQRDQLLAALKEARRWLNGDSWRNGNLSERKCWEEFTTLIDETIAAAEGGNQS